MEFKYDNKKNVINFEMENSADIEVIFNKKFKNVQIQGNKKGLETLGNILIALSDGDVPNGFTTHLDAVKPNWNGFLNPNSLDLRLTVNENLKGV